MKKLVAFSLVVAMFCIVLCSCGQTNDKNSQYSSEDYFIFTLNKDKKSYIVEAADRNMSGSIVIPSKYNGLPVTTIYDYAFEYCNNITKITIPDSVTYVGDYAFSSCHALTSVTFGKNVKHIGAHLFSNSNNIKRVVLQEGLEYIGVGAFNRPYLMELTIPESVTYIGVDALPWDGRCKDNISYNGTVEQWNIITLGYEEYLNAYTFNIVVHCTDGDIEIKGTKS